MSFRFPTVGAHLVSPPLGPAMLYTCEPVSHGVKVSARPCQALTSQPGNQQSTIHNPQFPAPSLVPRSPAR